MRAPMRSIAGSTCSGVGYAGETRGRPHIIGIDPIEWVPGDEGSEDARERDEAEHDDADQRGPVANEAHARVGP